MYQNIYFFSTGKQAKQKRLISKRGQNFAKKFTKNFVSVSRSFAFFTSLIILATAMKCFLLIEVYICYTFSDQNAFLC